MASKRKNAEKFSRQESPVSPAIKSKCIDKIKFFFYGCYYKWWFWLLIVVVFLTVTQILFSFSAPYKWLEAVWSAGDLISFVGTMALGCVAITQTNRANEMSNRANEMSKKLMELEISRYKLEVRPFVMVSDYKAYELTPHQIFLPNKLYIRIGAYDEKKNALGIALQLLNTTESFLTVEFCRGSTGETTWTHSEVNQPNEKLHLPAGESQMLVFYADIEFITSLMGKTSTIELILENRFAERYKETFQLIVTALSGRCVHKQGEWYISCVAQNYKIGKFIKNSTGKLELKMEDN